jgi:hypothetical protein
LKTLWPLFNAKKCSLVVGLQTVYKTNYSTSEGSLDVDAELVLPIRYARTSAPSPLLAGFLEGAAA